MQMYAACGTGSAHVRYLPALPYPFAFADQQRAAMSVQSYVPVVVFDLDIVAERPVPFGEYDLATIGGVYRSAGTSADIDAQMICRADRCASASEQR